MAFEIKICGITNVDDARAALALGADYLGFVMYPPSPRSVTSGQVRDILSALAQPCRAVGVFVNTSREEVEAAVRACGLWAAQLHGDETAEAFAESPVRLWRALKVLPEGVTPDPAQWAAERFVVDAAVPGVYGGTGVTADWQAACRVARERAVLLAGGLTPENVEAAIHTVRPLGVDVSSGVECEPGRKDRAKMESFVKRARAGFARERG